MTATRRTTLALLATLTLSACGASVELDSPTFPTPLVEPIDMHVGLRLSDDMYDFWYEEDVLGKETWSVDMGDANAMMFKQLFGHMFTQVTHLEEDDNPADWPIDALVETNIDKFEFSVPQQTGNDAYAIWIRYRLKVYDPAGDVIGNWAVSAYGKSEKGGIGSGDNAMENAALLAMRDAAALMIMKLDRETGISRLAKGNADDETQPAVTKAANETEDAA
ncbi:MAG: hypothetical protein AAF917_11790 [Pseudomonadota bacterium]